MTDKASLQKRVEHLEAELAKASVLEQVSRDLNTARNENELLLAMAQTAIESGLHHTELLYIELNENEEPEWAEVVAAWQREDNPPVSIGTRYYLPDIPFMELVFSNPDELLLIPDVDTDERLDENIRQILQDINIKTYVIVPLRHAGRWIGTLPLHWDKKHEFTEHEIRVYSAIITLAGAAVDNRRMIAHQQQTQLAERQRIIEAQKAALLELSTPIIPVMQGIIILPLIGSIDTQRAREIMRALLEGIAEHRAKVVILDITGVPLVDTGVANHLDKTVKAARLKGAHTIITGISDSVAETIVELAIDWTSMTTLRDLQSGLVRALEMLGLDLKRGR